ncbi:AAA family ATPase [Candidatus Thiodiazotropha sp. CDECU1]|uniref:AAA family ATPase n=1 Tax=Candidatus Thiodiazotropha sp. CDECU1 TaxID=3065865 RepID=UPI00292F3AC9|nr:AAA family ATPase [Candidatus Thiodiazotropha sp. CDECU1]
MSDANDFFSTSEVSARLDLVRHLIENSELVPLVRGPSGIGKTLLATRLQQLAPENWSVCHFDADPTMQPERLLATIARCCGLPDIAGELLQRLVDRFEVLRKRGRIPVMLVDDAQMLPPTSLITLLRLFERQLDGVRLVSIVLFADEQIDLLLSTPQLQVMSPQAIQVIDLPLMTRQEAAAYMLFLLKSEGLSENLALDEVKLSRIYRETKGNPGLLASAILNAVGENGNDMNQSSFLSGYRKQLLIGGLPLLVVVLLLMWLISSLFEPEPVTMPDRQVESTIDPLPAPASHTQSEAPITGTPQVGATPPLLAESGVEAGLVAKPEIPEKPADSIQESTQTAELDVVTHVQDEVEASPASAQVPEDSAALGSRDGGDKAQQSVETSAVAELATDVDQADVADAGLVKQPELVNSQPADEAETGSVSENSMADRVDAAQAEQEIPQPASVVETADRATPVKPAIEDAATAWVKSRSPSGYTLQLIAVENLDSLKRYIEKNGLAAETHTLKTTRKGKPWYALLWGDFPDRESALQAASALPAKVQKTGVWARTFSSLQQSIAQ